MWGSKKTAQEGLPVDGKVFFWLKGVQGFTRSGRKRRENT